MWWTLQAQVRRWPPRPWPPRDGFAMKALRVLHLLDHSAPLHSGYAFRTLAILREQRRLGWHTDHLTSPKQGPGTALVDQVEGWTFHRTPSEAGCGLVGQMQLSARRLSQLVSELKPDLLHVHSPVLNALPALWVGRRRGLPVVYEMRASSEDAAVDHGTTTEGSLRYRVSRGLETVALHLADQVTTICEGLRGDISSRGVSADKVTVIPNAVDVTAFHFGAPPDEALRKRLGLEGATVVGFAGSFYAYEGLHLLIEAAQLLLPSHPTLRLLLVGGGPQDAALKAQAAAAGLADRVVFTGRVPHDQVQRYYELIDVLAYPRLPIRLTELVTPLKPLEAMAQGRMFVASDVGGHRELVQHGRTGHLFQAGSASTLAQALQGLLSQRDGWQAVRQQARHFVEIERTWAGSVGRYHEVYRRALATKGRQVAALN